MSFPQIVGYLAAGVGLNCMMFATVFILWRLYLFGDMPADRGSIYVYAAVVLSPAVLPLLMGKQLIERKWRGVIPTIATALASVPAAYAVFLGFIVVWQVVASWLA